MDPLSEPTQAPIDAPSMQTAIISDLAMPPHVASNVPYLATITVMFAIGIAGVAVIAKARPETDILTIIAAVFAFLTPTTASILAFQKAQETHLSVNSRLDSFVKNAQAAALAVGKEQGAKEANLRTDTLKQDKILPIVLPPVKIDITNGSKK